MPRLFTALRLSNEATEVLALKRGGLEGARWIDPIDYHITLSFVGDVEREQSRDIEFALDELELETSFEVRLAHLDCFGSSKPRSLYVHAEASQLERLKVQSDSAMRKAGIEFDRRKFVPHVTLARLKQISADEVANYLSQADLTPVHFVAETLCLLSSRDSRGGGPYRTERIWPFQHPADRWLEQADDEEWPHMS